MFLSGGYGPHSGRPPCHSIATCDARHSFALLYKVHGLGDRKQVTNTEHPAAVHTLAALWHRFVRRDGVPEDVAGGGSAALIRSRRCFCAPFRSHGGRRIQQHLLEH